MHRCQHVGPSRPDEFYLSTFIPRRSSESNGNISMSFIGQVLRPKQLAMTVLSRSFPELGLAESELSEGELARVGGEVRRAQLGHDSRVSRTGCPEWESTRRRSRRTTCGRWELGRGVRLEAPARLGPREFDRVQRVARTSPLELVAGMMHRWQHIGPSCPDEFYLSMFIPRRSSELNSNISMSFTGQVLGPKQLAMTVLSRSLPELGLAESELSEGELALVGGEVRWAQLGRDSRASRTGSPERESTRRGSRRTTCGRRELGRGVRLEAPARLGPRECNRVQRVARTGPLELVAGLMHRWQHVGLSLPDEFYPSTFIPRRSSESNGNISMSFTGQVL
jgi:hypothetical protein